MCREYGPAAEVKRANGDLPPIMNVGGVGPENFCEQYNDPAYLDDRRKRGLPVTCGGLPADDAREGETARGEREEEKDETEEGTASKERKEGESGNASKEQKEGESDEEDVGDDSDEVVLLSFLA